MHQPFWLQNQEISKRQLEHNWNASGTRLENPPQKWNTTGTRGTALEHKENPSGTELEHSQPKWAQLEHKWNYHVFHSELNILVHTCVDKIFYSDIIWCVHQFWRESFGANLHSRAKECLAWKKTCASIKSGVATPCMEITSLLPPTPRQWTPGGRNLQKFKRYAMKFRAC